MDKLRECPFCGSDKVCVSHTPHSKYGILYGVECKSCNAHDSDRFIFEHYAINSWNTRPAEDALQAEVKRLKVALKDIIDDCEEARVYAVEIHEIRFIDEVEQRAKIALHDKDNNAPANAPDTNVGTIESEVEDEK